MGQKTPWPPSSDLGGHGRVAPSPGSASDYWQVWDNIIVTGYYVIYAYTNTYTSTIPFKPTVLVQSLLFSFHINK